MKLVARFLLALLLVCASFAPVRAQTPPTWITNQGGYSGDCYDADENDLGPNYPLPNNESQVVVWDDAFYDNGVESIIEEYEGDLWNYSVTGDLVIANLTVEPVYLQMDLWMQSDYHTETQWLLVPNGGSSVFPFNGITANLPTALVGYFYLTVTPQTPGWASGPVLACASVSFTTTEHN
ncbi:hypothetical protein [Candidatus Binatus soli]|jgi:hypothetical protein|uniref:hypothetical protein n=1 Tax=Candidatus Binatus soli TaxID=1953413 RepID=UPI003D0E67AF